MQKETILAKGFFFEKPRETAPAYVLGRISIRVEDATRFLNDHANANGYVDLDLMEGREGGKPYLKLNDWKPSGQNAPAPAAPAAEGEELNPADIPF